MTVYALADLHGYLDLYKQIKEFIQLEDMVIYLGDATDRGPQPWETIKVILDDPQFIYIKGNHDDMLVKAALDYWGIEDDFGEDNLYTLLNNGGTQTVHDMLKDPKAKDYIFRLKETPLEWKYETKKHKFHMSHAGYTPGYPKNLLWDRKHIYHSLKEGDIPNDLIIVHGHTPVYYQRKNSQLYLTPEFYANGQKINIDLGTYRTKACCLLNLDTLNYEIFQIKEN